MRISRLLRAAAFLVVLGFGAVVWPTPYRSLSVDLTGWTVDPKPIAARENRLTGQVDLLLPGYGWTRIAGEAIATAPGDSLHALARRYHR